MLRPVRNFNLIKEMFRINVNSDNRILTGLSMVLNLSEGKLNRHEVPLTNSHSEFYTFSKKNLPLNCSQFNHPKEN
jgi:hypothetical protein